MSTFFHTCKTLFWCEHLVLVCVLCPWTGKQWYGTVNLQRNLTTVYPGNACYSAPEAGDPTQQSPKMDVFSCGILLLEMLTGKFPDIDERADHLRSIVQQPLLPLVQSCLERRKEDRPTAARIITQLDH